MQAARIVPVTFSDLPAVLEVYRQCQEFLTLCAAGTASEQMVRQDMEHAVRMGSSFCGIYNADGEMMGIVDYLPQDYEGNPHHAWLELLMIGQPYRAQGVGAAAVNYVETQIRRNPHVTTIFAGVAVNNLDAIRFWQRQGYRIVGEPRSLPGNQAGFDLQKDLV